MLMIRLRSSGGALAAGATAGSVATTVRSEATSSRQTAQDSRWRLKAARSGSVSAPST